MTKEQIKYVCNYLKFSADRKYACLAMILDDVSANKVEKAFNLPKATASRDKNKVLSLWDELVGVAQDVNQLGGF